MYRNRRIADIEISGEVVYTRQKGFFDPISSESALSIIGCGGIGSMFAVMCGKLGIDRVVLYDEDRVEAHNLPNQFFLKKSLGEFKVDALSVLIGETGISNVTPIPMNLDRNCEITTPLIVSGVDSMNAREEIWECIKRNIENGKPLERYWDARIGGEMVIIFSVDLTNQEEMDAYERSTLYSDASVPNLPCTRRAVIDVMAHVGAQLLTGVRQYLFDKTVAYGHLYFNAETMFLEKCSILEYAEVNGEVANARR